MRLQRVLFLMMIVSLAAQAKEPRFYQKGMIAQMDAVGCGYEEKQGESLAGAMLGTDSLHKKTRNLLCQEYVLKSDRITYHIRPKDEKHPMLLPVGEKAEFRLNKDHMMLRVPELDDKERKYQVTSMTPTVQASTSSADTR